MLHLLGKGQAPEWNEDKHDIDWSAKAGVKFTF